MTNMRLGFHYHTPAQMVNGNIKMPAYLGLFVESLAPHCSKLICFQHAPLPGEAHQMDYAIQSTNVQLVDIGSHGFIPLRVARGYLHRRLFADWGDGLDAFLVRASTPLLPVIASVWRKPLALLIVSDAVLGIENLPQPGWRKALIRLWATWSQRQQMRITRRSLTFVNSRLLYEQMKPHALHLIETQTTTLSQNDFFQRADTCAAPPYRLLYAGRMTRIKGLFEIVQAMAHLVESGFDLVLDLVGMVDKSDPVIEDLLNLARSLQLYERVRFHGYKTAGPELLSYYRQADIFINASQASSEGFPRTIWEAMASSLPVVATEVGSIPAFVGDVALLTPPKQAPALAEAVKSLLLNPGLRQRMIAQGMALARNNTLEKRAAELMTQVARWVNHGEIRLP